MLGTQGFIFFCADVGEVSHHHRQKTWIEKVSWNRHELQVWRACPKPTARTDSRLFQSYLKNILGIERHEPKKSSVYGKYEHN